MLVCEIRMRRAVTWSRVFTSFPCEAQRFRMSPPEPVDAATSAGFLVGAFSRGAMIKGR